MPAAMDKIVTTAAERFWNPDAHARDQFIRLEAAKLPPGSRVLDAGAGASKYRLFFAHCRYETQDFCQYQGPLVKYLNPIDHICDITWIPLPDACVDAIVCTEVLEHTVDPVLVLDEFARLLKPGGRLLLTAPLLSFLHLEPYHYYGGFTRHWYEHWLPKKGFTVESITAVGGPGRSAVIFSQTFYTFWANAERQLSVFRRAVSVLGRAVAKVVVHWLLPRVLPRFDGWLGNQEVCTGYLVVATRRPTGR